MKAATVEAFLAVLTSKVTQYDKRASKRRGYNPNALALYLAAISRVRESMKGWMIRDEPPALRALEQQIGWNFTPDFSPAKATVKQINEYLSTGKMPSLVRGKKKATKKRAKKKATKSALVEALKGKT